MKTRLEAGDLVHAGAGTTLTLAYLGLIPGFIPTLALAALVGVVLVAPFVILGLAATLILAPPYIVWRLATRARRPRARRERVPRMAPLPVPGAP
jgi:hypothetical protein